MKFALVIKAAPYASQAASTAFNMASAILASGHELQRLFFYEDGVHNASRLIVSPQDERDLPAAWSALITEYELDAVVCVASALKRGVLSDSEAARYERGTGNLLPAFTISGLGQLVDAYQSADRVLTFAD